MGLKETSCGWSMNITGYYSSLDVCLFLPHLSCVLPEGRSLKSWWLIKKMFHGVFLVGEQTPPPTNPRNDYCSNLRKIWTGQIMYTKILKLESQLVIIISLLVFFIIYIDLIWNKNDFFPLWWILGPLWLVVSSHKTTHTRVIWSFFTRVYRWVAQIQPDEWQWNFLLQSLWYLRLFFLEEHNHCEMWMRELTLRSEVCQNHSAAHDIEQNCHLWQPGFHYSVRIYPSILRKSAFIRRFYRWTSGVITRDGLYFLCSHN